MTDCSIIDLYPMSKCSDFKGLKHADIHFISHLIIIFPFVYFEAACPEEACWTYLVVGVYFNKSGEEVCRHKGWDPKCCKDCMKM